MMVFIISCKDDDLNTFEEEKYLKKTISFSEFLRLEGENQKVIDIQKYFDGYESSYENRNNDEAYDWRIDTIGITQIVTDDYTTYTFGVIEQNSIEGFRNVLISIHQNKTKALLVHYYDGVDFENHQSRSAVAEEIQAEFYGKNISKQCFVLVYKEESDACSCEWGWHLVEVDCDSSEGGGGNSGGGNPGDGGGGSGGGFPTPGGYTPTDPNPGGGGGSGGGNSGNNGPPQTPCQSLKAKMNEPKVNNNSFKTRLQELKNFVPGSNHEKGYVNQNPNENPSTNTTTTNQYNFLPTITLPNGTNAVVLSIAGPHIFGHMHTHPDDLNSRAIHSLADIQAYLRMLKFRDDYGMRLDNTYSIVVGKHGVYSLKIDDPSAFSENYYIMTREEFNEFWNQFRKDYEKFLSTTTLYPNTKVGNEKALLNLLKPYISQTGLGLYRATDDLTNWEKITLNTAGNPIATECN